MGAGFLSFEESMLTSIMLNYWHPLMARKNQRVKLKEPKVFCIGFHKTGTTSLKQALAILGYTVTGPNGVNDPNISRNVMSLASRLIPQYDAFQDNPWPIIYKQLDRLLPDAKFILTIRDSDRWIESQVRYFGTDDSPMRKWIYGKSHPKGNEDIYRKRYESHNKEVLKHFAPNNEKLLVMNLEEGDGWKKLCDFLGESTPNKPFPHANRSRKAVPKSDGPKTKTFSNMSKINYYKRPPSPLSIRDFYTRLPKKYSAPPILIGGCGRSGTTLLQSIIAAHPNVDAINTETVSFCYGTWLNKPSAFSLGNLIFELEQLKSKPNANRFLEKTPRNIKAIKQINELFQGDFKFIHIIRDGRDVVCSHHPGENASNYHISPSRWVEDVTDGLKYTHMDQLYLLRYEDLLRDFTGELSRLCDFLELEYCEEIHHWLDNTTVKENHAFHGGEASQLSRNNTKNWAEPQHANRVKELLSFPGAINLLRKLRYL